MTIIDFDRRKVGYRGEATRTVLRLPLLPTFNRYFSIV